MDWKEFFKPTKGKIILSVIVAIIIYFLVSLSIICKPCPEIMKYENWPDVISSCDCIPGSSFSEFLIETIKVFVVPFIVTYVIYSLMGYIIHRKLPPQALMLVYSNLWVQLK